MGVRDNPQNQKNDLMKDPAVRDTIQRIATEHGMSVEDAQIHYIRHSD